MATNKKGLTPSAFFDYLTLGTATLETGRSAMDAGAGLRSAAEEFKTLRKRGGELLDMLAAEADDEDDEGERETIDAPRHYSGGREIDRESGLVIIDVEGDDIV